VDSRVSRVKGRYWFSVRIQASPIQAKESRALSISQLQFIFLAPRSLVLSFEPYTLTSENLSQLASSLVSESIEIKPTQSAGNPGNPRSPVFIDDIFLVKIQFLLVENSPPTRAPTMTHQSITIEIFMNINAINTKSISLKLA
jgi:hypothetical protein